MAASAAFGAALGAFLNVLFDRVASSRRFVEFITRQKLDDGLLDNLKTSMNSVRRVLDDAEEKEIREQTLKKWLDDLKNAFFEADDLLDEIDYEATRLERDAESRFAKFCKFLRPRKSFEEGLTKILQTIEHLLKQKDVHGLRENTGGGQSPQRILPPSHVERSNIFGRQLDQEAIMEKLLDDVKRSNNLSIISIVGLGGIGKTTLARLIYDDASVRNQFDFREWVCVSGKFDDPKITGAIAMACDHKTLNQIEDEQKKESPNQLEDEQKESPPVKRLLLVLDDVRNENFNYWEQLLTPLKYGGLRSTIIITTRNDVVARTVCSSKIFHLRKLDFTDCWQLFCRYAFDGQNPQDYPHLGKFGEKIVEKCDGLPLAVKIMGGVLSYNQDARYWEKVLKNDLWKFSKDGILLVLRLSYRYLPSHLKQCFAYCSIFPKNYRFNKKQLILLWMAEGFLIEQEGNETMEEVGEEYFEELVSRSFFQYVDNSFVMHDLINDLARVVAGDFCFRFENQDFCRTFDKLRYFSCVAVKEESSSRQLSSIFKSRLLRTFLPLYDTEWEEQEKKLQEMITDLFLNQQRLRVISLSRCPNVVKFPGSINHLEQHLRYLDLSFTSIKSLPEYLCSFYNLQTLKLRGCSSLVKLPTKMGRLINMHYLDIEGTKLQEMPPNMGKLIKLQTLTDFFVGKREGCGLKELGSLQQLGGTLRIHNLQHVVAKDAFEAKINLKKNLKELYLHWGHDNPHPEEAVLDWLQPHTDIEVISIAGYRGISFPNWLESGAFPCLEELRVIDCRNLTGTLQSHFPSLTKLVIENSPRLQNCVPNAPNLSSLQLNNEDSSLNDNFDHHLISIDCQDFLPKTWSWENWLFHGKI